jgi:hypothetical protein
MIIFTVFGESHAMGQNCHKSAANMILATMATAHPRPGTMQRIVQAIALA